MLHVDLTEEEKALLSEVLDGTLKDLSYEISDTDLHEYRDRLKRKREVLHKVKEAVDSARSD
ncbi:MAG: hypothetical protein PVH31_10010 [Ectothiorhodospiraceae bacterium]|jgi:hypothetical protein